MNREGLFYAISPQKEDIAVTMEKGNVIVPKGTYEHIGLSFHEVTFALIKPISKIFDIYILFKKIFSKN